MALRVNLTNPITGATALYHRVETVTVTDAAVVGADKSYSVTDMAEAVVASYATADARTTPLQPVWRQSHSLPTEVSEGVRSAAEGAGALTVVYDHLKTLTEYAASMDC